MMDINFFEPYLLERENKVSSNTTIIGACLVSAIFISGTMGYNAYTVYKSSNAVLALEGKLSDETFKEKYVEATAISKEKNVLVNYEVAVREIYNAIKDRAVIKPELVEAIYSTVPSDVLFKNISINGGTITIAAESSSEVAIANFQYNINSLGFIEKSYIPAINSDLGDIENFNFTITCEIGEGYYENN